ncbi:uncharacterized protein LOC109722748 [Ananas comosus]|uniref:Uncharacterized protein LOC109722748 n=2 Tax=Ananas comosus TaxID=4615 RepID=A0A6P5GF47_ANACO|nr:uncharacterized protein LOC109722748 [Ananas comosus]
MATTFTESEHKATKKQEVTVVDKDEEHQNDEEEFFELDLEVLNRIETLQYYEHRQTTAEALLANCLLPVEYICNAIPIESSSSSSSSRMNVPSKRFAYTQYPTVDSRCGSFDGRNTRKVSYGHF